MRVHFALLSKICGDICKSRYTTSINNTDDKFSACVKYTSGKFTTNTASVVDTSGKFATGVNDTGGL
jgi:hypothetical protein